MTSKKLFTAMRGIDRQYVLDAAPSESVRRKPKKLFIAAIAAVCAAVIILGVILIPAYDPYRHAYLSAEQVADVFPPLKYVSTSNYTEVYRPEARPFKLDPIPDAEYLPIYSQVPAELPYDEQEYIQFRDFILPRLAEGLGLDVNMLTSDDRFCEDDGFQTTYDNNDLALLFYQTNKNIFTSAPGYNRVSFLTYDGGQLLLDGRKIELDPSQSEEEILTSLEWVKLRLFQIFGVSYDSASVSIGYTDLTDNGCSSVTVTYFNETAGPYPPLDYININVDYQSIYGSTTKENYTVNYLQSRIPQGHISYKEEASCRRISLEEAEKLLYKGYVFGNHACPMCMAAQEKVSFKGYDYVGFEYIYDPYDDAPRAVPFYAFYKKIGVAKNGNLIYAKTYVCAVEVSGLDAYYRSQSTNHLY